MIRIVVSIFYFTKILKRSKDEDIFVLMKIVKKATICMISQSCMERSLLSEDFYRYWKFLCSLSGSFYDHLPKLNTLRSDIL